MKKRIIIFSIGNQKSKMNHVYCQQITVDTHSILPMIKATYKKRDIMETLLRLACSHGSLADRASVLPKKPSLDAVCMVAMAAVQLSHIIIDFIFFL